MTIAVLSKFEDKYRIEILILNIWARKTMVKLKSVACPIPLIALEYVYNMLYKHLFQLWYLLKVVKNWIFCDFDIFISLSTFSMHVVANGWFVPIRSQGQPRVWEQETILSSHPPQIIFGMRNSHFEKRSQLAYSRFEVMQVWT